MKIISVSLGIFLTTTTLMGQATIRFDNNISGMLVTHVYGFNPNAPPGFYRSQNGPADTPPGLADWSGWQPLAGTNFSAQIFAFPGAVSEPGLLLPMTPITHFNTGSLAGTFIPTVVTLDGVPADAPIATVQVRVWYNDGGQLPTWDQAVVGTYLRGVSTLFVVAPLGGGVNPPALLLGLQSFNIVSIPEPSAWAIAGVGVAMALLMRRGRR